MIDWQHSPDAFAHDIGDWLDRAFDVGLAVARALVDEVVGVMRATAPWQDRTGHARQGLSGHAERIGTAIVLTFFHLMDYGIWLEVAHAGTYAIIMPTILSQAAHVIDEIGYAMRGA